MKKYIIPFILLFTAIGCTQEEDSFQVSGDPYFNIVVRDDSAIPIAELEDMSAQYTLTLGSSAWSSAKNTTTHVLKAPRFWVSTNMRWKVVSATGEEESWIHPFPGDGEKEGIFFFKMDRNIDPVNERTAMYNILVDDGSGNYEALEGILKVTQEKSDHFLEMNAAKFNVAATGQRIKLMVTSNVDWDYELAPSTEYGTSGLDWIVDESEHYTDKQVDTLVFNVTPNELGIRGANLTINYTLDGEAKTELIPITQYPAVETELEGFPVKWVVRMPDNTFADTWPSNGTIPPVSGSGLITFHNEAGQAADTGGKVKLDVSDNSPRAAGVWPGDYLEFVASSPVSAGSIVKLAFATRVSGTGQKYWRLEFRDGDEWKIVGNPLTEETVAGPDGNPVVYTHAMAADGATNILVESLATYTVNTDQVEFRFICAANYQANGGGPLAAPNGGTWRLSVNEKSADDAYQPQISIVAAGAETLTRANMTVTPNYLVFEGKNGGSRKFNVTSDQDFTLTPSQSWIHVSATESISGEDLSFTVTCDDNNLTTVREGVVTVKAGITRTDVAVIQGSGAADLQPLISIVDGNTLSVDYTEGTSVVNVQSNVDISTQSSDSWLSVAPVAGTKAAVEAKAFELSYSENPSKKESRTATVRFYNETEGLESILTVTQSVNKSGIKIYFQDDFSWLAPYVAEYVKAVPDDAEKMDPVGSNLATHAQPNIWGKFSDTIGAAVIEKGYVDLEREAGVGNNTLYMQDCYFKMGAGNKQTGLRLPAIAFEGSTAIDVELSFDFCAHMSGAGNIDNVPIVVVLSGAGTCADSGAATSNEFVTTQTKGNLAWQHASVVLKGVTSATSIELKPSFATFKESGNHRWHLDNIVITEAL